MRIVKHVSFIFVLLLSLSGALFASDATADASITETIGAILEAIIQFASWIRVILAIIAGKVMTNDLVYGEFLGFDTILWQMRVVNKQIASFAIGGMFLFYVLKFIFTPDETTDSFIKQKLGYLILGGILIQFSWFGLGAMLDIATISTAAVGSMPTSLMNEMKGLQQTAIASSASVFDRYIYSSDQEGKTPSITPVGTTGSNDEESIMDILTPSTDTLSGPLLYLGAAIFSFQDYTSLTTSQASSVSPDKLPDYIATVLVKFGVILLYSGALFLLILINVFRLLTLWLIIPFSPLLIIARLYKASGGGETKGLGDIGVGNFGDLLKIIFAPTIFTGALGFCLIVILSFIGMMTPDNKGTILINDGVSIIKVGQTQILKSDLSSTSFEGDIFAGVSEKTGNIVTDLLIVGLSLGLIWFLVKLSIDMLPDGMIGKKVVEGARDAMKGAALNVPIIPTPAGGMGVGNMYDSAKKIGSDFQSKLMKPGQERTARFKDNLYSSMGIGSGFPETEKLKISKYAQKPGIENMNEYIKNINGTQLANQRTTGSSIYELDTFFTKHYKDIATQAQLKNKTLPNDVTSLATYFSKETNTIEQQKVLKRLHESFGGKGNVPISFKKFEEHVYSVDK